MENRRKKEVKEAWINFFIGLELRAKGKKFYPEKIPFKEKVIAETGISELKPKIVQP